MKDVSTASHFFGSQCLEITYSPPRLKQNNSQPEKYAGKSNNVSKAVELPLNPAIFGNDVDPKERTLVTEQ